MPPPHDLFGTVGQNTIHPGVLTALILVGLLILFLPRKYVPVPFLIMAIIIPMGQVILVGPAHFTVIRMLVFAMWIRLLIQRFGVEGPASKLRLNTVDKAILWYAATSIVCYTLLWRQFAAFNNQAGVAYNVVGTYFACRFFVRDREDIERAIKTLVVIASVIAVCMINEQMTGLNILAMFGGLPLYTLIRSGQLRSQGPFEVFLTAGNFGATMLPLILILFRRGGNFLLGVIGLAAAVAIMITARTSTALCTGLAAGIGLAAWFIRSEMKTVRWCVVGALAALQLTMKAPVWSLIARIDLMGGSNGWHRFMIVDNCVRHFSDWFLFGARNYWQWEGGDDMWDLANQYVETAETTGLLPFIFFMAALVYCYKRIGIARKAAAAAGDRSQEWFLWLLGAALFANSVGFFGISYFDQSVVYWYLLAAIFVNATEPYMGASPQVAPAAAPASEFDWYRPMLEENARI